MTKESREKVIDTIIITRINNNKRKGIVIKSFHYEDGVFFENNNLKLSKSFLIQYIKDIFNEGIEELRNKTEKQEGK